MGAHTITVTGGGESIVIAEEGGERSTYEHHADNAAHAPMLRDTHTMYRRRCQSYRDVALSIEQADTASVPVANGERLAIAEANRTARSQYVAMVAIAVFTMAGVTA
ncbi:hypothetical protein UFOVP1360_26 [uncultured Caudovirales phage]|uniref:Uncharacterized protein n=1 Tax=uncultured Caudovirales phage TaxID=2100421 RepID=A0A6J5S4B2_9CAUD|nr:hypothetical protein UFOVP1360_26 [uncultured Caudovirales phage]